MNNRPNRRQFLGSAAIAALACRGGFSVEQNTQKYNFDISLAAWSLHKRIGKKKEQTDILELPRIAQEEFGIGAIELVNQQMRADTSDYVSKMAAAAAKADVKILLIMIDGAGNIGADEDRQRQRAVTNHKHWVDIAVDLGCHSIRMNWGGAPKEIEKNPAGIKAFIARSAPGFQALCEYGERKNINILLENHWGPSSYPEIVAQLVTAIGHPRFGTLPDFGNFPEEIDKYDAIDALMPYAKAVSAKCYDFDPDTGQETTLDFARMMKIVCGKHGYKGHVGIEFEGKMSEGDGIIAAKKLLETFRA
jgi:L-ribulose-5-phosphate 3-epimerase